MNYVIVIIFVASFLAGCEDPHNGPFRDYCNQHGGTYIIQPSSNPDGDACVDQRY
jgi:hypothetical protein